MPSAKGVMRTCGSPAACVLAVMTLLSPARAEDKTYVMKFTLPMVNEAQHQSAENYAAAAKRAQQDPAH